MLVSFRDHFPIPLYTLPKAFELFPNTRFLFGQKHLNQSAYVSIVSASLDRPSYQRPVSPSTSMPQRAIDFGLNFPDSLKLLLQAYLREGLSQYSTGGGNRWRQCAHVTASVGSIRTLLLCFAVEQARLNPRLN